MVVRAVSFEVGQTLLRPFPSFGEVFARCCNDDGVTLATDAPRAIERFADRYFNDLRDRQISFSNSEEQSRAIWTEIYTRFLRQSNVDATRIDRLAARIYATFIDHRSYELYDDAKPVLQSLRSRGFKVGITSNWESWLADLLVSKELSELVDFVAIS